MKTAEEFGAESILKHRKHPKFLQIVTLLEGLSAALAESEEIDDDIEVQELAVKTILESIEFKKQWVQRQ